MTVDQSTEFEDTGNVPFDEEEVYVFPTSFGQRRFWFLDQFEPGSPYYNIPLAIRVRGNFKVEIFRKVIETIVERHEILRTTFHAQNGEPMQIIHPHFSIDVPLVDLTNIDPAKRDAEIERLATVEARTPFDLARGPLFRVRVLKAGENDHVVLVTMHHIISDGWSIGVLVKEITTLYAAFLRGMPSPLPELPIQYADFAEWQREYLQGEVLEKQLNFWKKQLSGSPPLLELPTDKPRPQIQTNVGASERMIIPVDLTNKLNALARSENATLFMVLLAGLKVLLARYSGQKDISVGTPIANRNRAEIEPLIGLFINTLVLRSQLDDNPTFRELLKRERAITLSAYDHQDLPFEYLVDALQPDRNMSYPPLFQVMLILQNAPMSAAQVGDITFEQLDVDMGTSTHDLTFSITEGRQGLTIDVEYNTDLFERTTIQRLLKHYQQILQIFTENPDQPVLQTNFLAPDELKLILEEWNATEAPRDPELCIHHLFEKRVNEAPDSPAVVAPDGTLTYAELNRRANQFARVLREMGVTPETVVGVMLERQTHLLVAVLGVVKSGGAYLPLDPSYPEERLNYMLEDAGVSVLITQRSLKDLIPHFNGTAFLIDDQWSTCEKQDSSNPNFPVRPENLVYMIYTSGSTGKAKGTMIQHGSLVNAYLAWEEAYELRTRARSHLQMASFSFDVFSGDWTRALCSGGKLVLAPREILLEASELYQLMRRENITIAEFVPAVLRNLIQYLEETNQKLDFFRNLIAGSDIWYVNEYKKFLNFTGPETRLINSFGLTEATIDSTYFESRNLNLPGDRLVPIGKPFQNMTIYILDEFLQPVPIGVRGELYVGGLGLARGYFNRPDLTAERFLPNPFSKIPGDRMYKTGDVARYLPDGNIEFLGRADDQVKIRGFRVELGEVETALNEHPDVQTAAVVLREDTPGDKKLVGYFVPQPDKSPTNKELREFMLDRLPDYMVPSVFVQLDEMPLTPNGKVNRRALPAPDQKLLLQAIEMEYEAPRTPTEEVMAEIFSELLNVEKVGANHNFFELGGHSLLATQLVSRIRENFGVDLPLRHVFEKPTVGGLSMVIDQLKLASEGIQVPPIVPVSRDQKLPLSFAQQRLWFLAQLEPDSPFYNLPETYRISGPLDVPALERSLTEVVRRHEALRTTFHNEDGEPVQVIHQPFEVTIPVIDLTDRPAEEREKEIERLVNERAWQSIPIDQLPLFRVELIRLSPNEHVIILIMHHIIGDNWSTNILLRELAIIYDAFSRNDTCPLPPLQIQYADFAYWQRNWLKGEVLQKEIDFWKEQLKGAPPVLELPTDRPRPAMQTFNGNYKTFHLSPEVSQALKQIAKKVGATEFMALLAAFQTLLYRYSGQEDIVVGSPIANRNHPEIEQLIGFFVNTLALRAKFYDQPNFVQLLKQVRETALAAYAHQDLPFEKLVDALQPERNLSHSPIFQVMFALQTQGRSDLQPVHSELRLSPIEAHSKTAKFDLTLFMLEEADHFSGALEYNTDLFDDDTMDRFIEHFKNLLAAMVEQPEVPVSRLPLIGEAEKRTLLQNWNGQPAIPLLSGTVVDMFEQQVEKTPEAVAVELQDESWTYDELNRKANQLAHFLRARNIKQDNLVGVAVERSPQMLMALLGILKAGAAYVPLDINYPAERLQYMIEDAGLNLIITTEAVAEKLPAHNCEILKLDSDALLINAQSEQNPAVKIEPLNLAYVIYTSGSTGRPKGTLIHHQGLANYLNWILRAYPVKKGIGSLVHSTLAFDATVTAIYAPLITGKTVYLLPDRAEIDALGQALLKYRNFSLIKITPAHLELLSGQIPPSEADSLTHAFVIGGENLTAEQIAFWQENAPNTLLFNEYGPTETVVGCVVFEAHQWQGSGSVPIGRAIPNTRVYVLDSQLNPVPIGVPGELYIGGAGVARGYLNRPDLTAERFIPDPFSSEPGARLYKTGDLVRYLKSGQMEFLGRVDHQVKIRGYRIELGEIENVIREFDAVTDAVALVRNDFANDPRLVAYLIVKDQESFSEQALREHLKQHLPDYMIPGWFVMVENWPLTPNGKIDRKALPRPDYEAGEAQQEYVAPRTAEEEILCGIWQDILHIERVGVHHNFFELGGHSLLATQLISRIRDAFGVELPLKDLFEAPTVAQLILKIDQARMQAEGVKIPPLRKVPRSETLPLSFAQQRLWFLDQLSPESPFYNIPAAVRIRGKLNVSALQDALREIIRRHETLRTIFVNKDGQPQQVILDEQPFDLPLVDLEKSKDKGAEVKRFLNEDAMKPFKLDRWPLFRCQLLKLGPTEHIFMFTMHHIISDGWSTNVFMREVGVLYEAFSKGLPSPLPELPIQYADFAAWQRSWLKDEVLEKQLEYWRKTIGINPPVLNLPFDRPRPAVQTFNGDAVQGELPGSLKDQLNKLAQKYNVTPFMVLLAAFQTLLHHYANQDEILVGTPIANRTQTVTEDLIGFFVNTLVLRADFNLVNTFEELLKQVRENTLGAYAHQDLPFEQLVEALQPERDMSHSPIFQVMFVLQNTPPGSGGELAFPSIKLEILEAEERAAKFDLTLVMAEAQNGYFYEFEYNTDLFERSTIQRLAGHFETLLNRLLQEPRQPIEQVELVSPQEKKQIVEEWNQTAVELPAEQVIHLLFEQRVAQSPDHPAVVFNDRTLTFDQLNREANRLARVLHKAGVGPETAVAISVERSPETVIGLLSILKAGGVYLPIDPAYPEERIAYIINDSGASILLTQKELAQRFEQYNIEVWTFEDLSRRTAGEKDENLPNVNDPQNLAYMIYTSGSTGKPKGTMLAHRGLVNLTIEQIKDFALTPERRVLQFASFSFDASVSEIFTTLISGATLYLADRQAILDVAGLINRWQITTITLPPSVSSLIDPEQVPSLHTLVSAGEACTVPLAKKWYKHVRFLNAYGPTENTVCASRYFVTEEPQGNTVPIGRPIGNVQLFVLNKAMKVLPVGVPGELYIGGINLARGYLNRPDLTAERFVPNPFAQTPGERLYKTGDLVRWLPDGNIEFLGRIDFQVKIRGFRIELGEIENVLNNHPQVENAVVLVREDRPGQKYLAAYCVIKKDEEVDGSEIRAYVARFLPDYMVPQTVTILETFPLTPNGKIDRRALPRPDVQESSTALFVAPSTDLQNNLAEIWQELLGLEKIGIHQNFFESGGHSLLATQLASRIQKELNVQLPLAEIFKDPTIAGLEKAILRYRSGEGQIDLPPIEPQERGDLIPLSYAQQRLWFLDQLEPESPFYNLPAAVRVRGPLNVQALSKAFQAIIQRHEILRTAIVTNEGRGWQKVLPEVQFEPQLIDLTTIDEKERLQEAHRLLLEETRRPFKLDQAPLLRVKLLRLSEEDHVLVLVMHHIISDGWSMNILIGELGAAYQAFARGKALHLQPLPIQYADFAIWQRKFLAGETLEKMLAYWKQKLADAPPLLNLPTDRPRPPVQTFNGKTIAFHFSEELTRKLNDFALQHEVTLYMLLLALFKLFLFKKSGQKDILVGSPIANRNRAEIEPLIGFFVNTLVLRSAIDEQESFEQFLKQVKQTALEAYAHQDVPFEMVVDAVQPERAMNHSPLFQVVFTLQNTPQGEGLQAGDLRFESFDAESNIAKFDLTLSLIESGSTLSGTFEFNTDLFDDSTIETFIKELEFLAQKALEQPEATIEQLPVQPAKPLKLKALPEPTRPISNTLKTFFSHCPEGGGVVAVSQNQSLTYTTFLHNARQLASKIDSKSVQSVGLLAENAPAFLTGLLAAWLANKTVVPLTNSTVQELVKQKAFELLLVEKEEIAGTSCVKIPLDEQQAPAVESLPGMDIAVPLRLPVLENDRLLLLDIDQQTFLKALEQAAKVLQVDAHSRVLSSTPVYTYQGVLELLSTLSGGGFFLQVTPEQACQSLEAQQPTHLFLPEWTVRACAQQIPESVQFISFNSLLPERSFKWQLPPQVKLLNVFCLVPHGFVLNAVHQTLNEKTKFSFTNSLPNLRPLILDSAFNQLPENTVGTLFLLSRNGHGSASDRKLNLPEGHGLLNTGFHARMTEKEVVELLFPDEKTVIIHGQQRDLKEIETFLETDSNVERAAIHTQYDETGLSYRIEIQLNPNAIPEQVKSKLNERFAWLSLLPVTYRFGDLEQPETTPSTAPASADQPKTEQEALLLEIWKNVLQREDIGLHDNFFNLGGDSILTIQVIAQAAQHGLHIAPKYFFENPTIAHLAKIATKHSSTATVVKGPVPLTPIQKSLFEQMGEKINQFNTSMMFELGKPLDKEILKQTVQELTAHHPSLRLRFLQDESGTYQQEISETDGARAFVYHDLRKIRASQRRKTIENIASQTQESFDITSAPLFRFVYMDFGEKATHRLLIVFHHLIFDGLSWRVLIEDFVRAYQSLAQGKKPQFPPPSTPYTNWAQKLTAFADHPSVLESAPYWLKLAKQPVDSLKLDNPDGENTFGSGKLITISMAPENSDFFTKKLPSLLNASLDALFLSALGVALARWSKGRRFLVELYGHGRTTPFDDVDLSRAIGWFTVAYPFILNTQEKVDWKTRIQKIHHQLQEVPQKGLSYGLLRYATSDANIRKQMQEIPQPQINFNYLGQFGQGMDIKEEEATQLPFRMAGESVGPEQHPKARRPAQLYLVAVSSGGQLHFRWLYSKNVIKARSVKRLAHIFNAVLDELIQSFKS